MRPTFVRILAAIAALASFAASRPPAFRPDGFNVPQSHRAARHAALTAKPDVLLAAPNDGPTNSNPPRVGVVRALLDSPAMRAAGRSEEQSITIRSTDAARVRLHLTGVVLPEGARLEVTGAKGDAVAFGRDLIGPDGDLWTPSVDGDTIVISAPPGAGFSVSEVAHTFVTIATSTACFTDISCSTFPDRDKFSSSIAQLVYASGSSLYACTGGLINGPDGDRLLLTANHCISTQASASSLEATWDLRTSSCGGTAGPGTRTNGSALLATSATTDVTLVRLNSIPGQRWFMGWTTTPPAAGATLHRISHPLDATAGLFPQQYAEETVITTSGSCGALPRPSFLYSVRSTGGTEGGSSGSPIIIDGDYIVGQLYGLCGTDPLDGCSSTAMRVDGAMAQSYSLLQPFLDPQPTQCSVCVPDANTACALGGRFKITVAWNDTGIKQSGPGSIVHYADNLPETDPKFGPVSESVFFSFYPFAPKSIETLVRMLNGHGINDEYWVFVTGFTGSQYTVTGQDTKTCATWQRTIAAGATNVLKDFTAFPLP